VRIEERSLLPYGGPFLSRPLVAPRGFLCVLSVLLCLLCFHADSFKGPKPSPS